MGNSSSSPVKECLENAVGKGNVAFKNTPFFQLQHVKPYNLDVPVTPAAVTYPETADEIAEIVKCAVDNNLKVQARSGGHSYANYGIGGQDDSIVVDMKSFQQFSIDESTWQATIGAGTLLRDVTGRLHDNGKRAVTHGTSPQVGTGGHATIGGLGPTARMWGTMLDHVEEVEVVLANSSVVRASENQNSDVFFAVKGAAAGFGIVTEFKMRTQPEPGEAVEYSYSFHFGDSASKANVFKQWQKLISDPELSRKFASQFILTEQLGAIVYGTFFGSQEEFEGLNISSRLPTNSKASVELKDWLGTVANWAEDLALELTGGIPANFYAKSLAYTDKDIIPDDDVDKLFEYIDNADKGGALWFIIWDVEGGAINDIPNDATAYGQRDVLFYHQAYAVNLLGSIKTETREFLTGMNNLVIDAIPDHEQLTYAGYVDPALGDNSSSLYWGNNVNKLQRIKAEVDPLDVFHNPQSIRPAQSSVRRSKMMV